MDAPMLAAHVAAWLALAWSAVLAWLAIGAVIRRRRLDRRFSAQSHGISRNSTGASALIMRPCAGEDPALFDNLRSLVGARSSLPLHVVMAVDDPADRARPAIERALLELRAAGIAASFELVGNQGPNRKASILAGVLERHPQHSLVVNIDSNVDLSGFDFDRLFGPLLADDRIGTIWVPWSERSVGGGLGSRASEALLGGSLTAFPLLCGIYPQGLVGKFWAAPRAAIDRIAFAELAGYLGEDLEMARRLRDVGLRIEAASLLVRSPGHQPSFAAAVERFARWMLVVRGQKLPLLFSYPAFFFATPMVLALAAFGASASPGLALIAVGLALLARSIVTLAARRWSGRGLAIGAAIVDAVLADLVLGLAWLRAARSREVSWRGHRLRVEPDGRLRALDP
ncbi:glycosyltransferase [Nannocystaceae bacterium ST9]